MIGCVPTDELATPTSIVGIAGTVVTVTDGDSLHVETDEATIEIRMVAINAPERDECFYRESLDHLTTTLAGSEVDVEVIGEDQYGRTLAHLFENGRHVNLAMVNEGLAIAYTPERDDPYGDIILAAEEDAVAARRGLWAPTACGTTPPLPAVVIDGDASVPDPPGPDHEALHLETVVIVNEEEDHVDLSGWILRDQTARHRFFFPEGTTIGPGEAMAIASDHPAWIPGGTPVWANRGDQALLQLPDGTVVSRWRY